MTTLLALTLAVLAGGDASSGKDRPRKPSAIAPSLPALTQEEEQKLDDVIDRFIAFDIGQITDPAQRRKALADFKALGPEAIPALIRGLNRAALINDSCPASTISTKLRRMLLASNDQELLEFARENIGAGVGRTRYASLLADLRVSCMIRKNALARRPAVANGPKSPRVMSVAELAEAAGSEKGTRLRQVLTELAGRRGPEVCTGLCTAANSYDSGTQKLGRDLLDRHLGRQKADVVKEKLKDEQPEIRKAAIRVVSARMSRLAPELVDLLTDDDEGVRDAAHKALVRLSRGRDFGPSAGADKSAREESQQKWRQWWEKQRR